MSTLFLKFLYLTQLLCHFCPICSCPSRIGETVEKPNQSQQNLVSDHHGHPEGYNRQGKSHECAYFDEVTEEIIGLGVFLLDELELVAEPEGVGLKLEVRVLAARDLVLVDVSVAGPHRLGALEGAVKVARLFPVGRVGAYVLQVYA